MRSKPPSEHEEWKEGRVKKAGTKRHARRVPQKPIGAEESPNDHARDGEEHHREYPQPGGGAEPDRNNANTDRKKSVRNWRDDIHFYD